MIGKVSDVADYRLFHLIDNDLGNMVGVMCGIGGLYGVVWGMIVM